MFIAYTLKATETRNKLLSNRNGRFKIPPAPQNGLPVTSTAATPTKFH